MHQAGGGFSEFQQTSLSGLFPMCVSASWDLMASGTFACSLFAALPPPSSPSFPSVSLFFFPLWFEGPSRDLWSVHRVEKGGPSPPCRVSLCSQELWETHLGGERRQMGWGWGFILGRKCWGRHSEVGLPVLGLPPMFLCDLGTCSPDRNQMCHCGRGLSEQSTHSVFPLPRGAGGHNQREVEVGGPSLLGLGGMPFFLFLPFQVYDLEI